MGHCCQILNTKAFSSKMPYCAGETHQKPYAAEENTILSNIFRTDCFLSLLCSVWVQNFVLIYQDHCLHVIITLLASYQSLPASSQLLSLPLLQRLCGGSKTPGRADLYKQFPRRKLSTLIILLFFFLSLSWAHNQPTKGHVPSENPASCRKSSQIDKNTDIYIYFKNLISTLLDLYIDCSHLNYIFNTAPAPLFLTLIYKSMLLWFIVLLYFAICMSLSRWFRALFQ